MGADKNHPPADSATETESDPGWEPMRQKLVDIVEEILTEAEAAESLEPGPVDNNWAKQVL